MTDLKKPNLFIVGAPKCGTTAMHEYLSSHKQIFMSKEKEPFFFHVSDEADKQYRRYRGKPDKYLALFEKATHEQYFGESSPGYLYSEKATEEIFEFNPQSKILIMLRNPVDMLLSTYHHNRAMGLDRNKGFDEIITEEFRSLMDVDNGLSENKSRYLSRCKYFRHTYRYIKKFGKGNVHVVVYDDFKNDTEKTFKDVLVFLGLDFNYQYNFCIFNKRKIIRSDKFQNFLEKFHLSPYQIKSNYLFNIVRATLPAAFFSKLLKIGKKIYLKEVDIAFECQDLTVKMIKEYTADDIIALEKLLKHELKDWYK